MSKSTKKVSGFSTQSSTDPNLKKRTKAWASKLMSVILTTTLVVSMAPSFTAFAEEDTGSASVDAAPVESTATDATSNVEQSDDVSGGGSDTVSDDSASTFDDSADNSSNEGVIEEDTSASDEAAKESEDADKDDKDDKEKYPAVELTANANGTTVKVSAPEGALPKGATVKAVDVTSASIKDAVEDASNSTVESIQAIDVTIHDKDGKEIQPKKSVNVTFIGAGMTGGDDVNVYHYANGSVSSVNAAQADANVQSFSAAHFSIYVVTDETWIATYNFHDADGAIISTQAIKNGEKLYAPDTPEKDGAIFEGWATTPDASTVDQEAFDDPITPTVTATETIDWYPVYSGSRYVFFMDNQGRISTTKQGDEGDVITTSDVKIPLDSKHSVTGWYDNPELSGTALDSVTLGTENVSLYPKVEEGNYLTFVTGEGASYISPVFYLADQATEQPANPTRPGYEFVGWSKDESATTANFEFGEPISERTTAYAVWKANTNTQYTVIYWKQNINDSKNTRNNSQKIYDFAESVTRTGTTGQTVTPSDDKSYDGFHYSWNSGSAQIAGDGSTILNVYYDRDLMTIHFYEQNWYGSWNETRTFTGLYGQTLAQNDYTWPTDRRWNSNRGGNGTNLTFLDAFLFAGLAGVSQDGTSITVYGHNISGNRTINFFKQNLDGSYSYTQPTNTVSSSSGRFNITNKYEGFTANSYALDNNPRTQSNWINASAGTTVQSSTTTLNIRFTRNSYNLEYYNVNGADKTETGILFEASLSDYGSYVPERPSDLSEDYEFKGWYKDKDCTQLFDFDITMPANNLIVYAKWEAPSEEGHVHTTIDGGEGDEPIVLTIGYGEKINPNDMPTVKDSEGNVIQAGSSTVVTIPENNEWAGWATKDGDSYTLFNFEDTRVYHDIDLYPYYLNTEKFTVTYDAGDGSGTVEDSKQYAQGSYADVQPATNITAPDNKVFLYWKDNASGNTYYPGDKVKITGNMTLTAVYGDKVATTSLTIDPNYPDGTSAEPIVNNYANNETFNLPAALSHDGYVFVGWNTEADGSGVDYEAGELVGLDVNPGSPIAPTVVGHTLYGKWKTNIVVTISGKSDTITYDGEEHSVSGYNASYTVAGKSAEKLPEGVSVSYNNETPTVSGTDAKDSYTLDLFADDFEATYDSSKYNVTIVIDEDAPELKLTINKRSVTLTSASDEKEYDGTALTNDEVTVGGDGWATGEGATYDVTGSQTLVGSSDNSFTYELAEGTKAGNYNIETANGTLTVTDRKVKYEVTVEANSADFKYDGAEKSVSGFKTLTFDVEGNEYTVSGLKASAEATDAGTYEVKVVADTKPAGSKAKMRLKAAVPISFGTVSDADGNDVTSQFKINAVNGELTIAKRDITLTSASAEKVYDGKPLTNDEIIVGGEGLADGDGLEYTVTGSQTQAGSSENSFTYVAKEGTNLDNYNITAVVDGELTVTKAKLIVTTGSSSKVYDGKPLTNDEITAEGLVEGDATLVTTGSQTEVGTSDNTYEIAWNGDAASNYEAIEDHLGALTVTEKGNTPSDDKKSNDKKKTSKKPSKSAKTGDSSDIFLVPLASMLVAIFGGATALFRKRSKR